MNNLGDANWQKQDDGFQKNRKKVNKVVALFIFLKINKVMIQKATEFLPFFSGQNF